MAAIEDRRPEEEALQAYHDGELGFWGRRRIRRRLEHSSELRSELAELQALSALVIESAPDVAVPDLWAGIAPGLVAADAASVRAEAGGPLAGAFEWLFRPATALVAAGAAAAVLAMLLLSGETAPGGVVHWVDGGTRNLMVLDGEDDVTVIWVFDPIGDGASRGGRRGSA